MAHVLHRGDASASEVMELEAVATTEGEVAFAVDSNAGAAAGSTAWHKLFKQLSLGSDITRLSISAALSSPESALEKADRAFEKGGGLLVEAARASDPIGRMHALCRFVLSTALQPEFEPGFEGKKSHTPILGEHFASFMNSKVRCHLGSRGGSRASAAAAAADPHYSLPP